MADCFPSPNASAECSDENKVDYNFTCVICLKEITDIGDRVTLRSKGCNSINAASRERGNDLHAEVGDSVHRCCQRDYTNKIRIEACKRDSTEGHSPIKKKKCLRSENSFDCSQQCLFCCQTREVGKKKKTEKLIPVRTEQFQQTILKACDERGEQDKWALQVCGRLAYASDLCAYDVVYHNVCCTNFCSGYKIPQAFTPDSKGRKGIGRRENPAITAAFQCVVEHIECTDSDQLTISDLVGVMQEALGDDATQQAYSPKHMKRKLIEYYGDSIIFTNLRGKTNIVSQKKNAAKILYEFYQATAQGDEATKVKSLIRTAGQLILSEIKSLPSERQYYPDIGVSNVDKQLDYLPPLLRTLLETVIKCKDSDLKIASLGQAVVQAARPRTVIAPLQHGLGVQMHHMFGSRFLVESLNRLGFCISYQEVQKFEVNAAAAQGTDLPVDPVLDKGKTMIHHVADNVDHNIATLDGHGTFHGMGIVAVVTPGKEAVKLVPRKTVSLDEIGRIGRIGFRFYRSDWNGLSSLKYSEVREPEIVDETADLDLLWSISWPLKSPRPGWNGFMQQTQHGHFPGTSAVFFMPMIDANPGDMSCVFSTLHFVAAQAKKYSMTPVVTFDQPLFWKAQTIIASEPADSVIKNTVVLLGTFHLLMSYIGSIGHLMAGSGLQEAIETVYAGNSVRHILDGKAYSRAVRAHMLVDATLHALLISSAYGMPWLLIHHDRESDTSAAGDEEDDSLMEADTAVENNHLEPETDTTVENNCLEPEADTSVENNSLEPEVDSTVENNCLEPEAETEDTSFLEQTVGNADLDEAAELFESLLKGDIDDKEAAKRPVLQRIKDKVSAFKMTLTSRTSNLWVQYMEMIQLLRMAIKAERTGNFSLHLLAVARMLPFFAASGHNLYAKSARLYLQQMMQLEETHEDVFNDFKKGHHVMRRSDRYWEGLSCDLIIEQTLMRTLKTNGGLTRGQGMGEYQRLVWLLSMPSCASVNQSMQCLTQTAFATSEQHKESTKSRQLRDHKDTIKLCKFLSDKNPFEADEELRSIVTGQAAEMSVNVDRAKEIGQHIIQSFTAQPVSEVSFKKSSQALTMASSSVLKIGEEVVHVDPQLLFQRLLAVAKDGRANLEDVFQYELTTFPTSLFDQNGFTREANKYTLAQFLWSEKDKSDSPPTQNVKYVLDGGSLLHLMPWPKGSSYKELAQMYVDFVVRNYSDTTIIFDGYCSGPGTKDMTHLRCNKGMVGRSVAFTADMVLSEKKEAFLSNSQNKQQFLILLGSAFEAKGIQTCHAEGDADCLIVKEALQTATYSPTMVIGEDTDLLILLIHHFDSTLHDIFFASGSKKKQVKRIWSIRATQARLGQDVCGNILFAHAFCGCDTTSRPFQIAKSLPVKKLQCGDFVKQAQVFCSDKRDHLAIAEAGERAMVTLYNGRHTDTLDTLRKVKYEQKVASSNTQVQVKVLPPTSSAARYHSYRVYYQVQEWQSLGDADLLPADWGWELRQNQLMPITTDMAPAPEDLLTIIKCNCKKDCSSGRCSCRKHGLPALRLVEGVGEQAATTLCSLKNQTLRCEVCVALKLYVQCTTWFTYLC